jgi:transcriptional repressor NrdR
VLCPYCQKDQSRVIDTTHDSRGGVRRRRECEHCGQRFSTYERAILATPLIIKRSGTREQFNREKLLEGIKISCAKRPVSAEDINHLVSEIETTLQKMGREEVSSRVVGDMVIEGLKNWIRLHTSVTQLSIYNYRTCSPFAKRSTVYSHHRRNHNGTIDPHHPAVSAGTHTIPADLPRIDLLKLQAGASKKGMCVKCGWFPR